MSNQSFTRRGRTLTDYVDDLGATLPPDYNKFIAGGEFQDACVFCLASHNNSYKVYKINALKIERVNIECFACSDCGLAIDSMINQHFSSDWLQLVEMGEKRAESDNLLSRFKSVSAALKKGIFLNDVPLYYMRHNPIKDTFIENNSHLKCYRCDEYTQGEVNFHWYQVNVPVSMSSHITGGKVRFCSKCWQNSALDDTSKFPSMLEVFCQKCDSDYLIMDDERIHRDKHGFGDESFLCPECAYEQVDTQKKDSWLWSEENAAPRKVVMMRYKECKCDLCEKRFHIDLTMPLPLLNSWHKAFNGSFIKTLCGKCAGYRDFLAAHPDTIRFNNTTVINFNFEESKYHVYSLKDKRVDLLMTNQQRVDLSELICIAIHETEKLIFGTQGTLWPTEPKD